MEDRTDTGADAVAIAIMGTAGVLGIFALVTGS